MGTRYKHYLTRFKFVRDGNLVKFLGLADHTIRVMFKRKHLELWRLTPEDKRLSTKYFIVVVQGDQVLKICEEMINFSHISDKFFTEYIVS